MVGERRRRRERTEEEKSELEAKKRKERLAEWTPRTELGKKVMGGEIDSFEKMSETSLPLLEPEVIDYLLPSLEEKLVEFRKTTRVTRQGRNFSFRASVLVGDGRRHVGIGTAKDKEKWPAIRKATAKAKMNMVSVNKGCGSWECTCTAGHSIPFKVSGKCASVRVSLFPAPNGTGLVIGHNIKDVLRLAGITDVWSKTRGSSGTKLNFVRATINALKNTGKLRASEETREKIMKSERK